MSRLYSHLREYRAVLCVVHKHKRTINLHLGTFLSELCSRSALWSGYGGLLRWLASVVCFSTLRLRVVSSVCVCVCVCACLSLRVFWPLSSTFGWVSCCFFHPFFWAFASPRSAFCRSTSFGWLFGDSELRGGRRVLASGLGSFQTLFGENF